MKSFCYLLIPFLGLTLTHCKPQKPANDQAEVLNASQEAVERFIKIAEAGAKESQMSFSTKALELMISGEKTIPFAISQSKVGVSVDFLKNLQKQFMHLEEAYGGIATKIQNLETKVSRNIAKPDEVAALAKLNRVQEARSALDTVFKQAIREKNSMLAELQSLGLTPTEALDAYTEYVVARISTKLESGMDNFLSRSANSVKAMIPEEKAIYEILNKDIPSFVRKRPVKLLNDLEAKDDALTMYLSFKQCDDTQLYATSLFSRQNAEQGINSLHMFESVGTYKKMIQANRSKLDMLARNPQITLIEKYKNADAVNKIEANLMERVSGVNHFGEVKIKWPPGSSTVVTMSEKDLSQALRSPATLYGLARDAGVNRPISNLFAHDPFYR